MMHSTKPTIDKEIASNISYTHFTKVKSISRPTTLVYISNTYIEKLPLRIKGSFFCFEAVSHI